MSWPIIVLALLTRSARGAGTRTRDGPGRAARHGALPDLVQRRGSTDVQPRRRAAALVRVLARRRRVQRDAARPTRRARWRTGASRSAAGAIRSRPGCKPAAQLQLGLDAIAAARSPAAKTERERALHRRRGAALHGLRAHRRKPSASGRIATRWSALAAQLSGRRRGRRSSTRCRSRSPPIRPTRRTRASSRPARILDTLFAKHPRSSRPRALHHSQLRRAAAGRPRARGGAALREDRAVGAARAAHAVAHVHARRLLAGVDRHEHRVGRIGPRRRRRPPRSCTRPTIRRTRTCRPHRTARRARCSTRCRRSPADSIPPRSPGPLRRRPGSSPSPPSRRATRSNARPGPKRSR